MSDIIMILLSLLFLIYSIMAIVQVLSALYRYFFGSDLYPEYKVKLGKYLMFVLVYFLLLFLFWNFFDIERNMNSFEEILMFYTLILPWGLAFYFWRIVYHRKHGDNTTT